MRRFVIWMMAAIVIAGCGLRPTVNKEVKEPVRAIQQDPAEVQSNSSQSYLTQATDFIKKGKVVEAIRSIDEAIKKDPLNLQAYLFLGQTYMHLNEYDRAADSFKAALRVAPDQGEIYYMLAVVDGLRGQKDSAIANAEKALFLFQQEKDGENFRRTVAFLQGISQE